MTSPSELSFDTKPYMYSMLLKSFEDHTNDPTRKLEEILTRLEQERLKIDAFKRELPLCMQLLNNAMEASRQQLQSQRTNPGAKPVLEEFIPLKNTNSDQMLTEINTSGNINSADKANWMTSAQLWNQESEEIKSPLVTSPKETDTKLGLNGKQRVNNGGAFHPFSSKDRNFSCTEGFPELALASSHGKEEMDEMKALSESNLKHENSFKCGNNNSVGEEDQQVIGSTANTSQAQRKARRCWSPDLHRRFVNALHMLGGSQGNKMATPKQIRELMKVDGLTNDEVKSHLQKYRLHTRRPSPNPQLSENQAPQVVVLGGIWVPPEFAAAAAAAHGGAQAAALFAAHNGNSSTHHVPQEMYHTIAQPHNINQLQHHPLHHQRHGQLHHYNEQQLTHRHGASPESGTRGSTGGAADQSDSIEDVKSENSGYENGR